VRVIKEGCSGSPWLWPAGESLQVCDTTEGVLGLVPVVPLSGAAKLGPSIRRSTPRHHRKVVDAGQRIGRIRNPTRACLRMTVGTSEVDTVR